MTVTPGFVTTKMIEEMELPEKLTTQPEEMGNVNHSHDSKM